MGLGAFEKFVQLCMVQDGTPLVVKGFTENLDSPIFSEKWLRTHHGKKSMSVNTSIMTLLTAWSFLSKKKIKSGNC